MISRLSLLASAAWYVCLIVSCHSVGSNRQDNELQNVITNHLELLAMNRINKRATIKPKEKLWPGGRIPYILDPMFSKTKTQNILEAMRNWENRTCIRFVQREPDDKDYVYFEEQYSSWCETKTGRIGGKQITYLGACARNVGHVMHELGHVIGFYHEQNRPDRDRYIKVLNDNIYPRYLSNYRKFNKSEAKSIGYAYDYESIMHYSPYAFSNGNGKTFKIRKIASGFNFTVGQRSQISDLDVAQVREMYSCNKLPFNSTCITNDGSSYRGNLDFTTNGITCQRWNSNWPHRHALFTRENILCNGLGDHNYCRNPNGKARPWCFTTKRRIKWEYCDIKSC